MKYQLLYNGRGKIGTKNLKNQNVFVDYSQKKCFTKIIHKCCLGKIRGL